jgi:proteasome lid subunit RPN8/RPN11
MQSTPIIELVLAATLRGRIGAWARARYPREACGLLIGRRAPTRIEIVEVTEARNVVAQRARDRFELDPLDHLAAEESAAARGLEIVGVWHSHPDHPAVPSQTDRSRAWAGWSHVIVAIGPDGAMDVRAWRLVEGEFVEAPLVA